MDMRAMEKKLSRYNVERLGDLPTEKGRWNDESARQPNGRMRVKGD